MIYTWENRSEAFEELIMNYPGLAISDEQEDFVQMEGTGSVTMSCWSGCISNEINRTSTCKFDIYKSI